ncbi:V8-like Glu-specific endopeptidase [Herpetosiphon giganteus]|nr:V8-like Glu-specific endopeptidase [Herpetosiphon giganteus]
MDNVKDSEPSIAPVEWVNSGNTDYDWGIITLKCQIGYQTGVVGFSVTGNIIGQLTFLTGYPLGTPDGVDEGTSMWSGNGRIQKNNVLTFDYDNDTTSGQSGAVYWQPNNIPIGCSTPCIIGTHANSFDPIISPPAWNQGPRITQEVFDELYFWRQYKTHQVFISFVSQ